MSSEQTQLRSHKPTMWVAMVAAVGLGTAAAIWIRRNAVGATKRVDDILSLCDEAARALEDRAGYRARAEVNCR